MALVSCSRVSCGEASCKPSTKKGADRHKATDIGGAGHTQLPPIAMLVQKRCGIPRFYGFHSYFPKSLVHIVSRVVGKLNFGNFTMVGIAK